jgi:phospholipase/lecithinase/hemolysin
MQIKLIISGFIDYNRGVFSHRINQLRLQMKVLATLVALVFSSIVMATPLHNIVVFGDSLSDNGNLYEFMQHRIPISPPYFEGRFTNGPVWVERLTESYFPREGASHLLDYAFGGAGISDEGEDDDALFTLKHEIDVYLLAHQEKADPQSLFIIWIGANNYLAVPDDIEQTVLDVNAGIRRGMERLAKLGARHVLVLNIPDLGKTPIAREFEAEEQLTEFTNRHNETLANTVTALKEKYPDVQWVYFNANEVVKEVVTSPEDYGFSNVTDTCYDVIVDKPSQQAILKMASPHQKIQKTTDDICNGYMFFDPVHSTAIAHQLIADRVRDQLNALGVEFSN